MNFDPGLGKALTELIELISQGDLVVARERANALVQRYPDQAELWRLAAICALQQGELDAAQRSLDRALSLAPNSVESWCNLASVYTAGGRLDDGERALRRALALSPHHSAALNNLGSLLDARGDYHGAAECFAKAIVQKPDYARAWLNQAAALLVVRQVDRAESSARRAIQLAPQWADAHFVLGNVLGESGRKPLALNAYREAARLAPSNERFQYQLGLVLDEAGDFAGAARAYQASVRAAPDYWPALSQLSFLHRRRCEWHALPPLSRKLIEGVNSGVAGITPFSILVEESNPAQQLACAQKFAGSIHAKVEPLETRLMSLPKSRTSSSLRVGFFAAGFGEHPTALLISELVERLRNSSVHTLGYATTADDGGPLRKRLTAAFHEFRDVSTLSLEAMLRRLRDDSVDVLIDLDGYCDGARADVFALRPAPIQVNWLAYPGTLGAPWYDYLIADRFLIPNEQRAHYSEKITYLPRCYQPTDTTREIGRTLPRVDLGLPANGFVFACFNHSWKYTLRSFARFTKILKSVPDSVLWLLTGAAGSGADEQLRRAAHAAGIDPRRLIFALRAPHAEHLARYRRADLFLDTNPYNAHTTANDALWAGCPVLTQPGVTFASRVAGSLNHHLGLADMNVTSDQAYIDRAIFLARDAAGMNELRTRLDAAHGASGLFDMPAYARDFETALKTMAHRFDRGMEAQDFEVPA